MPLSRGTSAAAAVDARQGIQNTAGLAQYLDGLQAASCTLKSASSNRPGRGVWRSLF